jgi:hypothetical protein
MNVDLQGGALRSVNPAPSAHPYLSCGSSLSEAELMQ